MRVRVACAAILAVFCCLAIAADAPAPGAPAASTLNAPDLIARAQTALTGIGTIKAKLRVDVWYPAQYSNAITLMAAKNGDERAEIATTMGKDSFKSLEVISGGVVWSEAESAEGPIVTKIDTTKLKESLAKDGKGFAATPMLGTNALFDLGNVARIVDFREAHEGLVGTRKVYMVTGALKEEFKAGDKQLPTAAQRFYSTVTLCLGMDDLFPYRVDLGSEGSYPLTRVEFSEAEMNAAVPAGAFTYTVPEGATVTDRTAWALSELEKGR